MIVFSVSEIACSTGTYLQVRLSPMQSARQISDVLRSTERIAEKSMQVVPDISKNIAIETKKRADCRRLDFIC